MTKPKRKRAARSGEAACSPRRPPCALMTASAAMHADCAALKKLTDSGMEVVVVQDTDFEASLRILEKVRRETANAGAVPRRGSDVGTSPLLGQKSEEA